MDAQRNGRSLRKQLTSSPVSNFAQSGAIASIDCEDSSHSRASANIACASNLKGLHMVYRVSPIPLHTIVFCLGVLASLGVHAQSIFDPASGRGAASADQTQQGQTQTQTSIFNTRGASDVTQDTPVGTTVITNRPRTAGAAGQQGGTPAGRALQQDAGAPNEFIQRLPEARERIEFQDFVLQSTGRDLPLFGSELFRQPPSTFAPVDNIPVTPDYVIGPGDEIVIRAWGQIDVDYSAVVDRSGTLSIPKVGVLSVAGIKYQDLTGFLKTSFGRTFRNFELTASLGRLRSMQIFIVGQAKRPGTYTVSSLSTLVTALFSAGGPSAKGSMRSIQLKRGNKVVADLDLYDLLVSGDKSRDAQLLPGDVIYIPPVGPLVAINGSVNVPALYELKQNAPLSELVRWAGGLSTTAEGQKVTLERIVDRKVRRIEEFALDQLGLAHAVRDGDLVTVYALLPRFDNAITLRGNVAQPGRFPWRAGLRVRDLIPDKEALVSRDYWQNRNQIVGIDRNVAKLMAQDFAPGTKLDIADFLQKRGEDNSNDQTIADAIRRRQIESQALRLVQPLPTDARTDSTNRAINQVVVQPAREDPKTDPSRLVNQIKPSLKEVNWDYAVIERIRQDDLRSTLIPFNLGKAVLEGDAQQNLILQPGDVITIFSKEDIPVSAERQTRFIRLEGEFNSAGIYEIRPGETLRQLLTRVGGFASTAYLFGSEFTRESTRLQQQKSLDESLNRLERDIQRSGVSRAQNVTTAEDAASLKQQADSQQALIARLRALRPSGRIVLALSEDAALKDIPDLALEDGDRFFVPTAPSMVTVFGSVYTENAYIYKPGRRVADYLAQAGGPTKDADQASIYVLRADGSVISKRQSGFFSLSNLDGTRLMPGDSIVVPEELDKTTFMRNVKDIAQIFYQVGLGAAAIKVLRQ